MADDLLDVPAAAVEPGAQLRLAVVEANQGAFQLCLEELERGGHRPPLYGRFEPCRGINFRYCGEHSMSRN